MTYRNVVPSVTAKVKFPAEHCGQTKSMRKYQGQIQEPIQLFIQLEKGTTVPCTLLLKVILHIYFFIFVL